LILYITDNPNISKEISGSFLMYQLFDWTIKLEDDVEDFESDPEFVLKKRYKKAELRKSCKISTSIIGIVTISNYKLINDIFKLGLEHNLKVKIYTWEKWNKRKNVLLKKKPIYSMQNKYIQRGYLTLLMYQNLSFLNLQRIEQFLVLISIGCLKYKIKESEESSSPGAIIIQKLLISGYTIRAAVDKLIYHSRKGDISDPFLSKGEIVFYNENNSLFKKINKESLGENNKFLSLVFILESIFPLVDVLKTIRFLSKNDFLRTINGEVVEVYPFSKDDLYLYLPYLNVDLWNEIYSSNGFLFGSVFPVISVEKIVYACPICGSSYLRTTPTHFYCSDLLCPLKVNRVIKPGGIEKRITENEFIRLIHFGATIIKNRIGGYNRFFLQRANRKYWISSQIEKKISEE